MPEMETTSTGPGTVKTKWWSGVLTLQTVSWLFVAFVWIVLFWKDSKDNWDKTSRLEIKVESKADAATLKDLDDKVNRQYQTNREDKDRLIRQIEKALDWIEFEKGRQAGMKEGKKIP